MSESSTTDQALRLAKFEKRITAEIRESLEKQSARRPLPREKWGTLETHFDHLSQVTLYYADDKASLRRLAHFIEDGQITFHEAVTEIVSRRARRWFRERGEVVYSVCRKLESTKAWASERGYPNLQGTEREMVHAEIIRQQVLEFLYRKVPVRMSSFTDHYKQLIDELENLSSTHAWMDLFGRYHYDRDSLGNKDWADLIARDRLPSDYRVKTALAKISSSLQKGEVIQEINKNIESMDFLESNEKLFELKALRATTEEQKVFARKIRVKWILMDGDVDRIREIRSAPKLLSAWTSRHRKPAIPGA